MEIELTQIQNACGYIETDTTRGTGYLVRSDRVVTSYHVVKEVGEHREILIRFPTGERKAVVEDADELSDFAILKLTASLADVEPLRRASNCQAGATWVAYGYPEVAGHTGVLIEGEVRNPHARDTRGAEALQLFSPDAAAGKGARLQGFSGSPVCVRGGVIGHLNWIIPDEDSASQLGLVYACPIQSVESLLPQPLPKKLPHPQPAGATYDPVWYIHRTQQERAAQNCLAIYGAPAVLFGPELMGKTTLLQYLMDHARQDDLQEGKRSKVVHIDLQSFPRGSFISLEQILTRLGSRIVAALDGPKEWLVETEDRLGDAIDTLEWLMEERILPQQIGRLILAIESADLLMNHDFQDEFFGMLRTWSQSATREPWSRLRLILAISTTPSALTKSTTQSPFFNATTNLYLDDFDREQVEKLADLYGLESSGDEIDQLTTRIGGHPFLVRKAMYEAVTRRTSLSSLMNNAGDADGIFGDYLFNYLSRLEQQETLKVALCKILKDPDVRLHINVSYRLKKAGLIKQENAPYSLRYQLYDDYFRRVWGLT
jgi:hypothetical protein